MTRAACLRCGIALTVALAFALPSAGRAALLKVDFEASTVPLGLGTQPGFVAFDETDGGSATYPTTAGNVTVALINPLFNRGGVTNGGSLTFADIYNDFAFANGGSPQSMTVTLSGAGISANTDYGLTFYAYDDGDVNNIGQTHSVAYVGITGTAGNAGPLAYANASDPTTNGQYSVTGTFTSDGTGLLTIQMTDTFVGTALDGIRLNALEIASTAIPEPSSYALGILALAGFGTLAWRRRPRA